MVYVFLQTRKGVLVPVDAGESQGRAVGVPTMCLTPLQWGFSVKLELAACLMPATCGDLPVSAPPPKSRADMRPCLAFHTGAGI